MEGSKSNFFQDVYEVARLIPKGRVTSYGAIASYLGVKKSARMVGWAMNQCAGDDTVPAHRVVNRAGVLTAKQFFSGGPLEMERRLVDEGVQVKNDQIQNFDQVFWDPMKELGL